MIHPNIPNEQRRISPLKKQEKLIRKAGHPCRRLLKNQQVQQEPH